TNIRMDATFDPVTNLRKSSALSIPARAWRSPLFTSDDFTNWMKGRVHAIDGLRLRQRAPRLY
ncbi:MAG TPA: hypothetical protein VFP18_07415, partial [Candidatus Binatia bacterium]|nr:hypothetical protein [Candidatus Binatia bacterium]